jgi:hypothetical protein
MKTDLDRWVDLEGPPPEGVRELLDAVVPPLTAEHGARLDARVFAAVAEDRRRAARRRALTWAAAMVQRSAGHRCASGDMRG